jgi:purine-binding chemotaxis protein CheW
MRQRIAVANTALAGVDETVPEVMQQIWARRAAELAKVLVEEEEGEQIKLVLVQLGREVYGLDVQCVVDIKPAAQITPVPRVPDWVAGVVNLRGRILSVIDLRRFFGLPHVERGGENSLAQRPEPVEGMPYLVVVETPEMEVVLLADGVLDVEALLTSRMRDAADTVRGLPPEYVRGVAERRGEGDGMLVVLDLPALLADERLIIHEEVV